MFRGSPRKGHEVIKAALDGLLALAGRGPAADDGVEFVGRDPVLPTPFRIGEATAAILAAYGVLVSDIWQQRTGRPQRVRIDVRHAAATLHGCEFMDLEGRSFPYPYVPMDRFFRAGDGKWIHFQGLFPHLRDGTLALLGCADDEEAIAAATARWNALDLEEALAGAGLCGAVVRSAEDWASHPQGRTLMALPAVEIIRIGDSPPEPFGPAERPLSGVRVLDLTRVLAGPACGRTLAEHGADVIRIGAPYLPSVERCVLDTGHGKLSAFLDLRRREDAERLRELARAADVFSQGYRTGSLARSGLGPEALAELRPGIVYVSMNCYGHEGPWRERPGWEQMAEAATGLAWEQGGFERPKHLGAPACDYGTGYLAAFGVAAALKRRAVEGGSYHVRTSLCQVGMWIHGLGRVNRADAAGQPADPQPADIESYTTYTDTAFGHLRHLLPATGLSETPPRWDRPVVPLGHHPPAWPDTP